MSTLYLRSETKAHEKRTALSPKNAQQLLLRGHKVIVEKSFDRIFSNYEYKQVGCTMVEPGTWKSALPEDYVLGLKELPCEPQISLRSKHIYFAHAFKAQSHSKALLKKFTHGGGTLYDLEYLVDLEGKRVATFGFYAGVAGAALGLTAWFKKSKCSFEDKIYTHQEEMLNELTNLQKVAEIQPKILIIGGSGRCSSGVSYLLEKLQLPYTVWGRADTANNKKLLEIFNFNIFFNCIYVDETTKKFFVSSDLAKNKCLNLIIDISCEPGVNNPIPIYNEVGSFKNPIQTINVYNKKIDLIAIDNLPTLVPKDSSNYFSNALFKHLQDLLENKDPDKVWSRSKDVFLNEIKCL